MVSIGEPSSETSAEQQKKQKGKNSCSTLQCATRAEAAQEIRKLLDESVILIGHHMDHILSTWPVTGVGWKNRRCTATYPPYMEKRRDALSELMLPGRIDDLMERLLKRKPSQNLWHRAAASLDLYKKAQNYWEEDLHKLTAQQELVRATKQNEHAIGSDEVLNDGNQNTVLSLLKSEGVMPPTRGRTLTQEEVLTMTSIASEDLSSANCSGVAAQSFQSIWSSTSNSVLPSSSTSFRPSVHGDSSTLVSGDHSNTIASYAVFGHNDVIEEADENKMLPSRLLRDDSSSSSEEECGQARREESSHPVNFDDWLASDIARMGLNSTNGLVASPTKHHRRFSWFSRRNQEETTESKNVSLLDSHSSSHPVLDDDWDDTGMSAPSSFTFFRRSTSRLGDA